MEDAREIIRRRGVKQTREGTGKEQGGIKGREKSGKAGVTLRETETVKMTGLPLFLDAKIRTRTSFSRSRTEGTSHLAPRLARLVGRPFRTRLSHCTALISPSLPLHRAIAPRPANRVP